MAYTKVGWKDYPDTTTPVNAANLNQMDQGIADNASSITTQSEQIAEVQSDISQINTDLSELNKSYDELNINIADINTHLSGLFKVLWSESVSVTIKANTSVAVGTVESFVTIPNGYKIASVMCYSESSGNCITFIRRNSTTTGLEVWARNVSSIQITTPVYVRVLVFAV